MKKLIMIAAIMLCYGAAVAKDVGVDIVSNSTPGAATVAARARQVIFVFGATFTGSIAGVPFDGTIDKSLNLLAPSGDMFLAINYEVFTGTIRVVRVQ